MDENEKKEEKKVTTKDFIQGQGGFKKKNDH